MLETSVSLNINRCFDARFERDKEMDVRYGQDPGRWRHQRQAIPIRASHHQGAGVTIRRANQKYPLARHVGIGAFAACSVDHSG